MTPVLWGVATGFVANVIFWTGWVVGGKWTARQLREDTDGWRHAPADERS